MTLKWRPSSLFPDNSMLDGAEEIEAEVTHCFLFTCSGVSMDAPCTLCHPCMLALVLQDLTQNKCWKGLSWLTSISLSVFPLLHRALVCLCWKRHSREKALKERPVPAAMAHVPSLSLAKRGPQGLHLFRLKPQRTLLDVQREGGRSGPPLHPFAPEFELLPRGDAQQCSFVLPRSSTTAPQAAATSVTSDTACVFASTTSITNTCRAADAP